MKIIWSATARRKIDEIIVYISDDNLDAAIALVEEIESQVQSLKINPRLGRMVFALTRIIHQEIFLLARRRGKMSGRVPKYPEHDFSSLTQLTGKFRSLILQFNFEKSGLLLIVYIIKYLDSNFYHLVNNSG